MHKPYISEKELINLIRQGTEYIIHKSEVDGRFRIFHTYDDGINYWLNDYTNIFFDTYQEAESYLKTSLSQKLNVMKKFDEQGKPIDEECGNKIKQLTEEKGEIKSENNRLKRFIESLPEKFKKKWKSGDYF